MADPWDVEKVLAEFANEIPSEQNPYLFVQEYTSGLRSTDIPSWAEITSKVMLVSLIILTVQTLYNLYVMTALGNFTLGKRTSLGMWNFETINCNTLTALLFSILSVIDWIWEQHNFSTHQIEYSFAHNLIAYVKFVPVILGTWCFVWATVCHCVSIFWYRRNHANCTKEKASLPTYLKWIFHAFFLLPVVVMTTWVLLSTFHCRENRSRETATMVALKRYLSLVAQTDDGSADRAFLVSKILVTMRKANSSRIESIKSLNMVILAYLTANTFLLSVFMPLLCISWCDLKVKAEFLAAKLQQEGNESSDELAELMETTQDARATLLYRSLSVFFGLASCAPGTCWELYYSHKAFSSEYTYYRVVSAFLSQGVISIFLNIHLLIVNLHCRRLQAKQQADPRRLRVTGHGQGRVFGPSIPLHSPTETLEIHEKPEIIQSCY